MFDKTKAPLIFLVLLILASLFLAGGVFYLLQQERVKTISLEAELKEVKAAQKATEAKLLESKKTISDLELKLQEAASQMEMLGRTLEQEKAYRQEATAKIEALKTELEQQKKSRSEIEGKLTQAQEDVKGLQEQLKSLETKKSELETKVKDLESQVQEVQNRNIELGKVVVSPEGTIPEAGVTEIETETVSSAPTTAPATSGGAVLVVNKEYNFAVINLGLRDGVHVGDVFSIYRNNKYIGDVKVDKVHDAMSAAGFLAADMKIKVNEGDRVVPKAR